MPRILVVAVLLLVLSGCGEEEPEVIDVGARVTSAADALECAPDDEVETKSVSPGDRAGSPDALTAVQIWAKRVRRTADVPLDGYEVGVEEVGTVLFTHETDSRAEIAVVVVRTEDKTGQLGWVVESWARCRPGSSGS
jgi:hypothetical protein